MTYSAGDAVAFVTTPAPGTGDPVQTTLTYYDTMSRWTNSVQPDGASRYRSY